MGRTKGQVSPEKTAPEYKDHVGPVGPRRCRDVIFLIIFFLYWVGMFLVAGLAFTSGDPRRLMYVFILIWSSDDFVRFQFVESRCDEWIDQYFGITLMIF